MSKTIEQLVDDFEAAVRLHDDLGAIPRVGCDREEQALIDAERKRIKTIYTKAKRRLLRAVAT